MNRSDSMLDALGVVHYVVAGFVGLFGLLPLVYSAMGVAILSGHFPLGPQASRPPPELPAFFGWFMIVLGAGFCAAALALATALAFSGTYLRQRRRWLFCVVVAAIACSLFPFGTVLGVLTIVTLADPAVKGGFV